MLIRVCFERENQVQTVHFETMFTTPCVSRVACQVSGAMWHMSDLRCHVSHFTFSFKIITKNSNKENNNNNLNPQDASQKLQNIRQ